ncbi:MAG: DUF2971 domain-containing protein [Pirellulaceae bacterium]
MDSTDRLCLQVYADRFRVEGESGNNYTPFALCMTQTDETSHHWQLYASHSHGVCIVFDRPELCAAIEKAASNSPGVRHGAVEYLEYAAMKKACDRDIDKLPFVKRKQFSDEQEYRVIAVRGSEVFDDEFSIPIPLSAIKRIILGYRMPASLSDSLAELVQSFPGCRQLIVRRSTFMDNGRWRVGLNSIRKRLRKQGASAQ